MSISVPAHTNAQPAGLFIMTVMNLLYNLGRTDILTISSLLIHEHGLSLHLSKYSLISLSNVILVWWGGHDKIPQVERRQQQKFIIPQFWRLVVQVQDVGSFGFFWDLWRADGHLLAVSARGLPSVCVCIRTSFSDKDAGHMWLGPALLTSFYLDHLSRPSLPTQSHAELQGVRTSTCELGGGGTYEQFDSYQMLSSFTQRFCSSFIEFILR